jgi:hypothetical protein
VTAKIISLKDYSERIKRRDTTGGKDMIVCPVCTGDGYVATDVGCYDDCWLCKCAGRVTQEDATYDKIKNGE